MTDRVPNVATIPPGAPFLPTLVERLLDGTLVDGFRPLRNGRLDPLLLAEATVFVPTRRAARALATTLLARGEVDAALLPDIRPLGDADEDELLFGETAMSGGDPERLLPTIDPLERQLLLTALVRHWWRRLGTVSRALYGEADVVVPASLADAAWFARDLSSLMDAVETEEADWGRLEVDGGGWWQLTAEFLRIATEAWPAILAERGVTDPSARRGRAMDRVTAHLERKHGEGEQGPVIVAGGTGSNPAARRLMKAVAALPRGLVVLPGLDCGLDDETWERLADPNGDPHETATHPQHGMKRLLQALGTVRRDVRALAEPPSEAIALRERIVSEALRPANATGAWKTLGADVPEAARARAFAAVSLVEAANEREEAASIACAMQEVLDRPSETVALVTPDRNLARRVCVELERFGVLVDDSAGQPLAATPAGTFARLLLAVGCGRQGEAADTLAIMALVKHPRLRLGFGDHARRGRLFELAAARGQLVPPEAGNLLGHVLRERERTAEAPRAHPARKRLSDGDWKDAEDFAAALDDALRPLLELDDDAGFAAIVRATIRAYEACARPGGDAEGEAVHEAEDGEAMASYLAALRDVRAPDGLDVSPLDWPDTFVALMADRAVRRRGATHARAFVWGPLEARLQHVDRMVLGGLNEETWPASVRNDAFLSRPMKAQLPLEPPERRIGLAAHDIQMLLGAPDVVATRALRAASKPTVASRWWQRVEAVAGAAAQKEMRERGRLYRRLAADLDEAGEPHPAPRPAPAPPLPARPGFTSVTEIERYVRDPYAVYARRVLQLEPMEPLSVEISPAARGTLYHAIMEQWSRGRHDPRAPGAMGVLMGIAETEFSKAQLPEAVRAVWLPRFEEIAHDFLDWERDRASDVRFTRVEARANHRLAVGTNMTITAYADRIDTMRDGSLAIIDYKTGTSPSVKQAETLTAPQLPLEAALAARGAFERVDAGDASELVYVRLRPGGQFRAEHVGREKGATGRAADKDDPAALGQKAWDELERMMTRFADPAHPYLSRTRPMKAREYSTEYDHLARVREWMLAEEEAVDE